MAPVRVVETATPLEIERGRGKEKAPSKGGGVFAKSAQGGRSPSRASSVSRTSSQAESSTSDSICRTCRSMKRDPHHDYRTCAVNKAKRSGPFCSYCGSRGLEYAHEYSSCKRRLARP